ncbi:MAG: SagB/ThcOx family dehydrogenase [Candidatus Aminicenantes bacterium]|nr:SagB/ThcOx family dehydrogenase [Candidatus Aminicenantes bacterium]
MSKKICVTAIFALSVAFIFGVSGIAQEPAAEKSQLRPEAEVIKLPAPRHESGTSVEKAINLRRSIRGYADDPLSISEISQLLWAAQGFTQERKEPPRMWNPKYEWQGGLRTAPSAGALYPMEIYLLAGNVEGLAKGVYKFVPKDHSLKKITAVDKRTDLCNAALKQGSIEKAAAVIVMAGVYERTSFKYGERAERYVHIEVGSIAENVYLQGMTLGIGTVIIGAFADKDVKNVLQLPEDENPLAIMPLGKIPKTTDSKNS